MLQTVTCPSYSSHPQKMLIQAYLGDIAALVPDHRNKASTANKASHNPFAGGGSYLQFVKNASIVKSNKMRYACNVTGRFHKTTVTWGQMFTPEQLCIKSLVPSCGQLTLVLWRLLSLLLSQHLLSMPAPSLSFSSVTRNNNDLVWGAGDILPLLKLWSILDFENVEVVIYNPSTA